MDISEQVALITINETLFIQILSFLIFLFIINRLMFRPLKGVMDERDATVKNTVQEVTDTGERMKDLTAELQKQEAAARAQARGIEKDIEDRAKEEALKIITAAREEIAAEKLKASEKIEEDIAQAKKSLEEEANRLSRDIMERILDRSLVS